MISIIIPTYNNLELFKRAYQSVISQTEKDVEVIVVDDSSTNEIQDYCLGLPVLYRHNVPALGAVKNWNCGLRIAKGGYVILMHHDEAMKNVDFLSSVLAAFDKGYEIVVSNIEVQIGGKVRKKGLSPVWLKRFFISHSHLLLVRNLIGPCACIAFKRDNLVFFDDKLKWQVDMEWYFRLLNNRKVVFLPDNWVGSIHGHKGQITKNLDVSNQARLDSDYLCHKYQRNVEVRCSLLGAVLLGDVVGLLKRLRSAAL